MSCPGAGGQLPSEGGCPAEGPGCPGGQAEVALTAGALSSGEAALKMTASTPGLTGVLISTTNAFHWRQAAGAMRDPLPKHRLKELCALLSPDPA